MQSLRTSATDIDALRYYRASEDGDLGKLIRQLRREEPPTEAMMAGTALHAALEIADPGAEFDAMEANGYRFDVDPDCEVSMPAIRERKQTREYAFPGCIVTLVGKVDAIHGRTVYDHKFTGRFNPDRFLNSFQWRAYLEIFGADEFVWNVFEGREVGDRHYKIGAFHRLGTHRYPEIGADVWREVGAFLDFAKTHLPERFTPWEPTAADFLAVG